VENFDCTLAIASREYLLLASILDLSPDRGQLRRTIARSAPLCSPGMFLEGEYLKLLYNGGKAPRELGKPAHLYSLTKIGISSKSFELEVILRLRPNAQI
jgi:hypothetical protein